VGATRAHILFKSQEPREKRRLLDFVVSNCTWKNGQSAGDIPVDTCRRGQ